MNQTPPRVDVVIPTIGRGSLAQAMMSALTQTYANVRVVVIADKHTDQARTIYEKIRALAETVGTATAVFTTPPHQFGRGDLVKEWWIAQDDAAAWLRFLDDDDWMPPTSIADLMAPVERDPSVVLVTPVTIQVHSQNGRIVQWRQRSARLLRGHVVANAALFKRAAAIGVKLESDPADPRFWLHDIAERGKAVELKLPLYWYNATRKKKPNPMKATP